MGLTSSSATSPATCRLLGPLDFWIGRKVLGAWDGRRSGGAVLTLGGAVFSYLWIVTPRERLFAFGLALALVLAGGACAVLLGGVTGQVLTIVLIAAGVAGAVLLVFLEVGLSEDRELARDEERRRGRALRLLSARRGRWVTRRPRRPDR